MTREFKQYGLRTGGDSDSSLGNEQKNQAASINNQAQDFNSTPNVLQTSKSISIGQKMLLSPNEGITLPDGSYIKVLKDVAVLFHPATDGSSSNDVELYFGDLAEHTPSNLRWSNIFMNAYNRIELNTGGGLIQLNSGDNNIKNWGTFYLYGSQSSTAGAILSTSPITADRTYSFPDQTATIVTVTSGSGTSATSPVAIGQTYIDTTAGNIYIAKGTASDEGWVKVN